MPIVITSLGAASQVVDAVHGYGGLVFHDVTTLKHARKAAEAGVDGIIAVAAGAGGHAGTLNPFVLAHEIRSVFDGTLLLAGGLSHGEDILAAQAWARIWSTWAPASSTPWNPRPRTPTGT